MWIATQNLLLFNLELKAHGMQKFRSVQKIKKNMVI